MDNEEIKNILKDSYDLHVHANPSHFNRSLNDFELLEEASKYEMAGVMIKNHYESTAGRAALINDSCKDLKTRAYGGLVLNKPAGGINPYAAESALKLGAAFIWMPTRDAENCLRHGKIEGDFFDRVGIKTIDEKGKLVKEVYEIFEVIKKYDGVLATGHLSVEESIIVCKEARKNNVRIVFTHPEWEYTIAPASIQKELADIGVIIEKNWYNVAEGNYSLIKMAENIKVVGADRVFLATDRGQAGREHPVEGLIKFINELMKVGISEREIHTMIKKVPRELVQDK